MEKKKLFHEWSSKAIKDTEKVEKQYKRRLKHWVDFKNNEECKLYMRERAQAFRDKHIPKNKICVKCGILYFKSKSWVVMYEDSYKNVRRMNRRRDIPEIVECRGCYSIRLKKRKGWMMSKKVKLEDVFVERIRYVMDGWKLAQVREIAGLTQKQFAEKAKWSRAYQNNIEQDKYETLGSVSVIKILKIFKEAKVPLGKFNLLLRKK